MVPPFSEAVVALENGKFSKLPVQTQFGWHVILREESRALTPPPLDAVKEQIRPMLQRQKAQTMIENLRKGANVEILMTPEPKPAEPSAPAVEEAAPTPATDAAQEAVPAAQPAENTPETAPKAEPVTPTEAVPDAK
jgi:peptidyl-prolyl cis-trans isomerase C